MDLREGIDWHGLFRDQIKTRQAKIKSHRDALQIFYQFYANKRNKFSLANGGHIFLDIESYILLPEERGFLASYLFGPKKKVNYVLYPFTFKHVDEFEHSDDMLTRLIDHSEDFFSDFGASIEYYPPYFDGQPPLPHFTVDDDHYTRGFCYAKDTVMELSRLMMLTGGLAPHEGTYQCSIAFMNSIFDHDDLIV